MQVAIVLPLYQDDITPLEQISMRHLEYFLSDYPRIVVKPVGLAKTLPGYEVISFPMHHFASIAAYSKLLLSPEFYETFSAFEYILIYQLDCLVFSRDLLQWCQKRYDYIGSPLYRDLSDPTRGFSRVGNGGLSLRRVETFLKVLNSEHIPSWHEVLNPLIDLEKFTWPYRWFKKLQVFWNARRGVKWYVEHYTLNEDLFWSDRAKLFYPKFRVAPVEQALQFAIEAHPRYSFEKNRSQLPFGVHAWAKWDRNFWESYIKNLYE